MMFNIDINNDFADKAGPGEWNDPDSKLVSPGVFTSGDLLIMPPKKGGTGANKQRQDLF
ncbi:unnamed protein product, partial [Rotaria sp. Silwood2]